MQIFIEIAIKIIVCKLENKNVPIYKLIVKINRNTN